MKKLLSIFLCAALLCSAAGITASAAASAISVIYDGDPIEFDIQPEKTSGHVLAPAQAMLEAFGAKVKWDSASQTLTAKKKSKTIEITVGSAAVTMNDKTFTFDPAPVLKDGTVFVPVRALSEMLGLTVAWDSASQSVIITTPVDEAEDAWKENEQTIDLSAFTISSGGSVSGTMITITAGGDYTVTGTCNNGQILVDSKEKVKLRLAGMSLTNPSGAAIYFKDADKAYITIEKDTENYLTDGKTYTADDDGKQKGCITARDNLEIKGGGSLTINALYNHGIFAADSLEIENGVITINAENDGIHVNDTCRITGGEITVSAKGDGIQAEEIIDIVDGTLRITTTGAVASSNASNVRGRTNSAAFTTETEDADATSKGIKADWLLDISGGTITLNTTDHAIHCTSDLNITGGKIDISSGNKGISAHGDVVVDDGTINITKSTEGIESKQFMTINGGKISIIASDDGLNAGGDGDNFGGMGGGRSFVQTPAEETQNQPAGETLPSIPDNSFGGPDGGGGFPQVPIGNTGRQDQPAGGMAPDMPGGGFGGMMGGGRGFGQMPVERTARQNQLSGGAIEGGGMGGFGGMMGSGSTTLSDKHHIQINGGEIYICADNDGIDSNGSLVIDGGTVIIEGRSVAGGGEMGLDTDMALIINGGEVLAAGSLISESGAGQNTALIYLSENATAGSKFEIRSSNGETLASMTVRKQFNEILYSSAKLENNKEYTVYVDGQLKQTFTVTGKVTTAGTAQNSNFGGMGGRGQLR